MSFDHEAPGATSAHALMVSHVSEFVSRREASDYLKQRWGVSRTEGTLALLATKGGGPAFRKDGRRVLYAVADLDSWAQSRLSTRYTSTSDVHTSPQTDAA